MKQRGRQNKAGSVEEANNSTIVWLAETVRAFCLLAAVWSCVVPPLARSAY